MDPNVTLERARSLTRAVIEAEKQGDQSIPMDTVVSLAEAFGALDLWLIAGGFLPKAWDQGRPRYGPLGEPGAEG